MKRTPSEQALPRVTCSDGRIRAVFGPLVKSNIHVKGKIAFFVAILNVQPMRWMAAMFWNRFSRLQSAHSIAYIKSRLSAFALNPSIMCALLFS